jgi:hypothetical protein
MLIVPLQRIFARQRYTVVLRCLQHLQQQQKRAAAAAAAAACGESLQ